MINPEGIWVRIAHNSIRGRLEGSKLRIAGNYGSYDRLTDDGISQWHPAFLALGKTLELCAKAYRNFCQRYKPKPKPERKNYWGQKKLATLKQKLKAKKKIPGQQDLWDEWALPLAEIEAIAKKFVLANCFNPNIASLQFTDNSTNTA